MTTTTATTTSSTADDLDTTFGIFYRLWKTPVDRAEARALWDSLVDGDLDTADQLREACRGVTRRQTPAGWLRSRGAKITRPKAAVAPAPAPAPPPPPKDTCDCCPVTRAEFKAIMRSEDYQDLLRGWGANLCGSHEIPWDPRAKFDSLRWFHHRELWRWATWEPFARNVTRATWHAFETAWGDVMMGQVYDAEITRYLTDDERPPLPDFATWADSRPWLVNPEYAHLLQVGQAKAA